MVNRFLILCCCLYVSFFIFTGKVFSSSNVVFSDDFSDGDDSGWKKVTYEGPPSTHLWRVVSGQYTARVSTPFTIIDSVIDNSSWTNYIYEFDMKPTMGTDTNFVFRWRDNPSGLDYSYDVHQAFGLVWFQKMGPPDERFDPNIPHDYWPAPVSYQVINGQVYHWRVEVNGTHIAVFVTNAQGVTTKLFDFDDYSNPYLVGGTGVRIKTGTVFPTEVYFDNVVVTEIDNHIDVPYSAQNDPNWFDKPYDHLAGATLGDRGCALTSALMVLQTYGIDRLPDGSSITPLTLNNWLNEQEDSAWRAGNTSWGALMNLAKQLHEQNPDKYPILKFLSFGADFTKIDSILTEKRQPLIFREDKPLSKSLVHFVTARGVVESEKNYAILDPLTQTRENFLIPPDKLLDVRYFYPVEQAAGAMLMSFSELANLSYIFLNSDSGLNLLVTDPNGDRVGKDQLLNEYIEVNNSYLTMGYPVANDNNSEDSVGEPFWETYLPEPTSGQYQLQFSAQQTGWYSFELYAYDKDANPQVFKQRIYVDANNPTIFTLNYSQDGGSDFAKLQKQVTFESLRQEVQTLYEQGLIKKNIIKSLLSLLTTAEKNYPLFPRIVSKVLANWEKLVKKSTPRLMTVEARDLLLQDLQILRENLGL